MERDDQLDLVETRVHLAAAQYHNVLAMGKLVPRPPSAPRSRPASAGRASRWEVADAPRRRSSELREAQSLDMASDALAVLLAPWGCCCYQAPPGVITSTLQDIAEMLRIAATRRERRRNLCFHSREKFLPRAESLERLHASLIGRSLGRSFANVLLMTKVLMAFREVMHISQLSGALARRSGWLRKLKSLPDTRSLEWQFFAWQHHTVQSRTRRWAEAEILQGRAALLEAYSQGRAAVSRAVDSCYAQQLQVQLLRCLAAWRDALRLSSVEGFGYHFASLRERTPQRMEHLVLKHFDEACLVLSMLRWAASCRLQRQGRVLEETQRRVRDFESLTSQQREALALQEMQQASVEKTFQSWLSRRLLHVERDLLEDLCCHWSRVAQALRRRRKRLQPLQAAGQRRREKQLWEAWRLYQRSMEAKHRAMARGLRQLEGLEAQMRCCFFKAWLEELEGRKAWQRQQLRGERRRCFVERRFLECSLQRLQWTYDAWQRRWQLARERAQRRSLALQSAEQRARGHLERLRLRCLWAWQLALERLRNEEHMREAEATKAKALTQALHSAALALEWCQDQLGPFHSRLLLEWRELVVQRHMRDAKYQQAERWVKGSERRTQESLLRMCSQGWQQHLRECRAEKSKAEAVKAVRREMQVRSLDALRRSQESDASSLRKLHFSAWQQLVLEGKIQRAQKEKVVAKTFGQILLDEEMLRSRCFHEWRDCLHHARHDAWHRAAEEEAEERRRVAHEQKIQVMREAFRSSAEALLGSAFMGWHHLTRQCKKHSEAVRARSQLNERRHSEAQRCLVAQSCASWRVVALLGRLRRRKGAATARAAQVLGVWRLRGFQGLVSAEELCFQAQILDLWRQEAMSSSQQHALRSRARRHLRERLEAFQPAQEAQQCWLVLCLWRQRSRCQRRWRCQAFAATARAREVLRPWWVAWAQHCGELRSQLRVAASCQNAREVQRKVKDRMLRAMEQLLPRSEEPSLAAVLRRWRHWAHSARLRGHAKDCAEIACLRRVETSELEWCCLFFQALRAEVQEARHRSLAEHMERQVNGARVVQEHMRQGWHKALQVLGRHLAERRPLRGVVRSWSQWCSRQRRRQRTWDLILRQQRLRGMQLLWHWRLLALKERSRARLRGSQRAAERMANQLREAWLLQQTFRGWQHARAYEELFRILANTQEELQRAAQATALAETAALAAQQRNQQVTVRVLPTPAPAWNAPSKVVVQSLQDEPTHFRAPVLSLQKDIQRHYAQRLQELRPSPRSCSFEVNIAQQGEDLPRSREAWGSP